MSFTVARSSGGAIKGVWTRRLGVSRPRAFVAFSVVALLAALGGGMASQRHVVAYVLIAAAAIGLVALVFAHSIHTILIGWVALEGIAYPFLRYPLHHNYATFDRIVVLTLGAALLLTKSRRLGRDYQRLLWGLAALTAVYVLRTALTHALPSPLYYQPGHKLQPLADCFDHIVAPFILFVVAARTITPTRWRSVAKAFIFLGTSVAAIGLLEWVLGFQLATLAGLTPFVDTAAGVVRVTGPYGDPTTYGAVIVFGIAATLYWLQVERRRGFAALALLIQLVALAPSFTKAVWGAALLTMVVAVGVRRRFSSRTLFVAVSALAVVAVIFSFAQSSSVIQARVSGNTANANVTTRATQVLVGVEVFKRWPIAGAGVDQFVPAQFTVPYVSVGGVAPVRGAHDTFVNVLGEMGLLGIVPLLFVVYAVFRLLRAFRRVARTREELVFRAAVLGCCLAYLVMSLTFNLLVDAEATMLLVIVLGATAGRLRVLEPGARARLSA